LVFLASFTVLRSIKLIGLKARAAVRVVALPLYTEEGDGTHPRDEQTQPCDEEALSSGISIPSAATSKQELKIRRRGPMKMFERSE